jgi:hypothetical protein
MKIVNKNGIEQIREHLATYSQKGVDHFTDAMLNAWASDVERSLAENDRAEFEICASESITGHTVLCRITDAGIDLSCAQLTE